MKDYIKAVRHDTLRAIENAGRLVDALEEAKDAGSGKLRRATKRFAKRLKEELSSWEEKSKKSKGGRAMARKPAEKSH